MKRAKSKRMGRPPITGETMRAYNLRLDDATANTMREYGDGNLSAGVRRAAEKLRKGERA